MAESTDANNVPEGTTLVFGSWACMADGSDGFSSHLVTPDSPKPKTTPQLADIREPADLDKKRVLSELESDNPESECFLNLASKGYVMYKTVAEVRTILSVFTGKPAQEYP